MDIKLKYRAWVEEKHADVSGGLIDSDIEVFAVEFAEWLMREQFKSGITPSQFYVVAESKTEEGNWEQISNGFDDYSKAVEYRDSSFCKSYWPNAFIVSSLNEG